MCKRDKTKPDKTKADQLIFLHYVNPRKLNAKKFYGGRTAKFCTCATKLT